MRSDIVNLLHNDLILPQRLQFLKNKKSSSYYVRQEEIAKLNAMTAGYSPSEQRLLIQQFRYNGDDRVFLLLCSFL